MKQDKKRRKGVSICRYARYPDKNRTTQPIRRPVSLRDAKLCVVNGVEIPETI